MVNSSLKWCLVNGASNNLKLEAYYGPRPRKSTGRHGHFLNLTCDIGLTDMRQGLKIVVTCDIVFSQI